MRRFLPSLSALHAFEAAARHMSFTKAAEDLGMTQSGISRQIRNLESYLGCKMFERTGPRLVLTEPGAVYFQEISQMLDKLQEVSIDVVRGRKANTSLLIGTHPTLATRWMMPRLNSFFQAHGDIPFEMTQAPLQTDFESSALDIAVLRGISPWASARAHMLFAEEIAVVAAPSLIGRDEQLEPLDFIRFPMLQNAGRPSMWLHWLRVSGLSHHGTIQGPRFPYSDVLVNGAINGLGLALVPVCYVERELANGELHMPFGGPVPSGETYFVVYPERKSHQQNIGIFRDWLLRETRPYRA